MRYSKKMKYGVYFVNTSRGEIIDEDALIECLETGHVKGAAVDVIQGEQNPNRKESKLLEYSRLHENLLVTPHIAGLTIDSQRKVVLCALEDLKLSFDIG